MKESDFEEIICNYPELIEEDLVLKGRQIHVGGKYVDLLFEDRHGQKLIVELKMGTIVRKHIAQLMDYEGHFLLPDNPDVRVMLAGNRVPPNLRRSLDHHGFEWREIPISYLIGFLKNKNDETFLKYFSEEDQKTMPIQREKKNRPVRLSPNKLPQLHTVESFDELVKTIRIRSNQVPTNYFDLLLLENKNKKLSQIITEFRQYAITVNHNDFHTISKVKAHIKFRESKGWVFEYSGDYSDPVVVLTGLKGIN